MGGAAVRLRAKRTPPPHRRCRDRRDRKSESRWDGSWTAARVVHHGGIHRAACMDCGRSIADFLHGPGGGGPVVPDAVAFQVRDECRMPFVSGGEEDAGRACCGEIRSGGMAGRRTDEARAGDGLVVADGVVTQHDADPGDPAAGRDALADVDARGLAVEVGPNAVHVPEVRSVTCVRMISTSTGATRDSLRSDRRSCRNPSFRLRGLPSLVAGRRREPPGQARRPTGGAD